MILVRLVFVFSSYLFLDAAAVAPFFVFLEETTVARNCSFQEITKLQPPPLTNVYESPFIELLLVHCPFSIYKTLPSTAEGLLHGEAV